MKIINNQIPASSEFWKGKAINMKRHLLILPALIGLFILLAGCGVKFIPVASPGAEIDQKENAISLEKDGIRVTVQAAKPRHTPYWTEGHLTSFLVNICNGTSRDISVDPVNFILFDEEKNQYNAIAPQDIAAHGGRYRISPFFGLSYWYGFPDSYYFRTSFPVYYYGDGSGELFWRSLPPTEIKPEAKVSGLVCFKAEPKAGETVRLIAVVRETEKDVINFEFTFSTR
ncbi:MAG: hypothetical protein JSU92_12150 [Deltaproteobacteria bacterium]|nr:MAG: hypothetical protein JSU92_12150 [Deltaproteobacteria bacterium]